jgi:transposase InsO family protein
MATLKRELIKRYNWKTRLDLELALVTNVGWYSTRRRHRSLKRSSHGQTPRQASLQALERYNQHASGSCLVPR